MPSWRKTLYFALNNEVGYGRNITSASSDMNNVSIVTPDDADDPEERRKGEIAGKFF